MNMPQTFPHINDLVQKLHETHDIAVAVELANAIMDVLNVGTQWKMQEPAEIYDKNVIPKRTFRNEKQQDWFCEHAFYPGQRVALYHFCEEAAPYESKFYQLNKNATKAVVAAGVMLTPNWEDSATTQNSHYKVGIDFFLNNTDDGLLMVSSNKFNLRVLEFKEKLTNTQIEILNNLSGLGTIKGLDKSGNFVEDEAKIAEPELEPQRAIHKKLWESLALKTINKKFYAGIAEHFSLLYQNMKAQGFDETKSKVFATRLIGRILFCWFLAKKNIVKSLPEHFGTYDKLKVLFYDTLNTPVSERKIDDVETPYLNGGLFEIHADDLVEEEIPFPENWLSSLYDHLQEYNFTTDESSPEYQQVAIDPEMLGCVFESLLGQIGAEDGGRSQRNDTGAFYTPREIVQFMCKSCLREHLYSSTPDAMHNQVDAILDRSDSHWLTNHSNSLRDVKDVREKVLDALRSFKVLDPACGSGAFPMGMLQLILKCRQRLDVDSKLKPHEMKKEILGNNIFGVDINPMAAEISRLRAWLSLMVDVDTTNKQALKNIEPLPNLDFKFVCANTLVSLSEDKDEFGTTSLFANEVDKHASMLANARNEYFSAKTPQQKASLKQHYFELRDDIKLRRDATGRSEKNDQLATWDPFDTSTSCEFFDSTEMFSIPKFDCVIGNPPYVQIQKLDAETKRTYKDQHFSTFDSMGDLYCLFYERAKDFLKPRGVACFITSNKWMRAAYGEKLRKWLCGCVNAKTLVDLGSGVFDSATVDTNILLYSNEESDTCVSCVEAKGEEASNNLTQYVSDNVSLMNFTAGESWVVLTDIEKSIKAKIEAHGIPLKDWDIKINRGILTGCNDAFIIDGKTKDELIAKDPKSAEILKPILRGRDIHRFSYDFADKWLIASHNGYVDDEGKEVPPINIEDYPAIKDWLDGFWDKIERRQDQGSTPYNLRNCAYMPDFEKPKIVWSDISTTPSFCFIKEPIYINNTAYLISDAPEWMVDFLNSNLINWYFPIIATDIGENGSRYFKQFVEKIPVPNLSTIPQGEDFNQALMQKLELSEEEVEFLTRSSS